jgi:hypothetical protein
MKKTDYGSLIAFTYSGSELREHIVRTIASKIKDDYCLLQSPPIQDLGDFENALINAMDGELIELYLKVFKEKCKNAPTSDHKLKPLNDQK